MKSPALTEQYAEALRLYFERGEEQELLRAYQLGRDGLAAGLGVLEIAALHQQALVAALLQMLAPADSTRIARRAAEFFAEALAPFEMSQRGFREANAILSDLNRELERRVQKALRRYRQARDELDEQKRIDHVKDEFISIVSHELRTPLTSIHGSLDLIRAGLPPDAPETTRRLLDIAHRNSQRLVRLVGEILDLQKIETGMMPFEPRPVAIGPFLEQALEANQAYAARLGVSLALEAAPQDVHVAADQDRLMQVMANLLSNAAKFSPKGAAVVVAAELREAGLRVTVTDRGPGIPETFRKRVFERFAQADSSPAREKGGTGLGLSIAKAIVERMGGRIGFKTASTGTTFFLDLPLARGRAESQPARA